MKLAIALSGMLLSSALADQTNTLYQDAALAMERANVALAGANEALREAREVNAKLSNVVREISARHSNPDDKVAETVYHHREALSNAVAMYERSALNYASNYTRSLQDKPAPMIDLIPGVNRPPLTNYAATWTNAAMLAHSNRNAAYKVFYDYVVYTNVVYELRTMLVTNTVWRTQVTFTTYAVPGHPVTPQETVALIAAILALLALGAWTYHKK